ncbi:hypothetical protein, partial [Klebsiella variicola]
VNGPQNGATPKSAFVTVPAGAVVTRYEIYMRASGSGAGSFGIVAPMISVAGIGQAAMPSFTPTPPPDSEQDIVSR